MVKKEENYNISDTGNWNVAADYSKIKIMKPLALCDEYSDIAYFGYTSFLEQLINFDIPKDQLKLEGFRRLIRELIKVIDNSVFAIKKNKKDESKKDEKLLLNYRDNLKSIEKDIPNILSVVTNNIKHTQTLSLKDRYYEYLELVLMIKRKINYPLNRHHLIFTDKEEFDPRIFKQKLKERMISQG